MTVFLSEEGHAIPCEGWSRPGTDCFTSAHGSLVVPLSRRSLLQPSQHRCSGRDGKRDKKQGVSTDNRANSALSLSWSGWFSQPGRARLPSRAYAHSLVQHPGNSPTRSTAEILHFAPFFTTGLKYIAGWRQHLGCAELRWFKLKDTVCRELNTETTSPLLTVLIKHNLGKYSLQRKHLLSHG